MHVEDARLRRPIVMLRSLALAAGSAGSLAFAAPLLAEANTPDPVRLEYTRGPGAETCPDEPTLRDAVAAKLGANPFTSEAARTLRVTITRKKSGLIAIIALIEQGAVAGTRTLSSPATSCTELASSVALAMSIAIDPLQAVAPQNPPPAPPAPPPEAGREPSAPPSAASPPTHSPRPAQVSENSKQLPPVEPDAAPSLVMSVSFGGLASLGTAPAAALGGALQVRARRGALSLAIEGRADLPASTDVGEGRQVESSVKLAGLLPCIHQGYVLYCAHMAVGALSGTSSGVPIIDPKATVFAAGGARVGIEWPFLTGWALRGSAELLATFTPTRLRIDGVDVWKTPPVSGAIGLAVVGTIP